MAPHASNGWVPLEVLYKGKRHAMQKLIQESQQDTISKQSVECFV
jgi:hypothetical protein